MRCKLRRKIKKIIEAMNLLEEEGKMITALINKLKTNN
jgi:hypothetical protein